MQVAIVKMPLEDCKEGQDRYERNWVLIEQYFETEEILEKERELNLAIQTVKDLRKEFNELKHPK